MFRGFSIFFFVLLTLLSSFSNHILTSALPASPAFPLQPPRTLLLPRTPGPDPSMAAQQHTLQPIHPLASQDPKLCGLPLLWLYPCTWTTDPSISRLEKLGPVIFTKYIINIPGTLINSILAPLTSSTTIKSSRTRDVVPRDENAGSVEAEKKSISMPRFNTKDLDTVSSQHKNLPHNLTLRSSDCHHSGSERLSVPNLFRLPTMALAFVAQIPRVVADLALTHESETIKSAKRDLVCKGGGNEPFHDCHESRGSALRVPSLMAGPYVVLRRISPIWKRMLGTICGECWNHDMPSKLPDLEKTTGEWTLKSSAVSLRTIPRIFTLPVMLLKTVQAIPLSPSPANNKYQHRVRSAPLELESLNGTTPIQDQKTSKALCWWLIWGYHCDDKPGKLYDGCDKDVPSKSEYYQTYTCGSLTLQSAGHATRSIPSVFAIPVMLLKAVHAIPVTRPAPGIRSMSKEPTINAAAVDLEDLCVEVSSSIAHSGLTISRLFALPALVAKTVYADPHQIISEVQTFTKSKKERRNASVQKRKDCTGSERQDPECLKSFPSASTSLQPPRIFRLPLLMFSFLGELTHAIPHSLNSALHVITNSQESRSTLEKRKQCTGSERQDPECLHSSPSSSTAVLPPRIFTVPFLVFSLLSQITHAIPFPRPATITNSIADPNFDLVRKSVGEMMDGVVKWLGRRGDVSGDLAEDALGWDKVPCRMREYLGDGIGCRKKSMDVLDSGGNRATGGRMEMAGLGVLGVAVVFAGFL